MITRPISTNCRVSIPIDYLREIAVQDGMDVDISVEDGAIMIRKSFKDSGIDAQIQYLKEIVSISKIENRDLILEKIKEIGFLLRNEMP